jgi:hypothetical protein
MTSTDESVSLWEPDVLGHGYECMDLPMRADEEGPVKATLIRYAPPTTHRLRKVCLTSWRPSPNANAVPHQLTPAGRPE